MTVFALFTRVAVGTSSKREWHQSFNIKLVRFEQILNKFHFICKVPKGGHEITLTQTSEECRKNLSSLENGIYDEDESSLFHFNPASAHIDVM